jgi:4-amino-4-deoxy-L-arabinose transferase-like glycosyltransferase
MFVHSTKNAAARKPSGNAQSAVAPTEQPRVTSYCATFCVGISALLICVLGIYYSGFLSEGNLRQYDEYHTLDRSAAFARHQDYLTVYSSNRPVFRKPPLQYWISAFLLSKGLDREVALRLPSYISGILLLITTGFLAYRLSLGSVFAALLAILLLSSSEFFWSHSLSAMLDAGAALFVTTAILASILALYQPRWWYLVALSTGLGALQKGPFSLAIVALFVLMLVVLNKWHNLSLASFRNRNFYVSALLAFVLVLWWPLLQSVRYGVTKVFYSYNNELLDRLAPGENINSSVYEVIIGGDEHWLRIGGIIALFCLPFIYRRIEFFALALIFIAFVAIMFMASGPIYARYGLLFLPLLMASLAAALVSVPPVRMLCAIPAMVIAFWLGQPFKSWSELGNLRNKQAQYIPALKDVSARLQPEETFVVCGRKPIFPGTASYFASNGRPFQTIHSAEDLAGRETRGLMSPPYRGLCPVRKFEGLKASLKSYSIVRKADGVVHWTSP